MATQRARPLTIRSGYGVQPLCHDAVVLSEGYPRYQSAVSEDVVAPRCVAVTIGKDDRAMRRKTPGTCLSHQSYRTTSATGQTRLNTTSDYCSNHAVL